MPLGTGANPGVIKLARKYAAATGSDNDYVTRLSFVDYNDNVSPEETEYARISTQIQDATDGEEDGVLDLQAMSAGGLVSRLKMNGTGIGFFGATPAAQIAHISDPAGGGTVDAEARTAIGLIIDALEAYGLDPGA